MAGYTRESLVGIVFQDTGTRGSPGHANFGVLNVLVRRPREKKVIGTDRNLPVFVKLGEHEQTNEQTYIHTKRKETKSRSTMTQTLDNLGQKLRP